MINNHFIIVIAGYNNINFVTQNINSVFVQDYKNYEIVFFDDASTDGTDKIASDLLNKCPSSTFISNTDRKYKTWFFTQLESIINIKDNDILVFLDGDDFLACENVLSYINEIYKQTNCWMTYGGMEVWDGENYIAPFPQNSEIPEQIKKNKMYRKDTWRTSHLKTMRGFLWKKIDKQQDLMPNGIPMVGPDDLAIMFAALEMCPFNKIYRVSDTLYIYNHSQKNQGSRAFTDHKKTGIDYESKIRSRNKYDQLNIVSPTLAGGLGNQMFEIAAAASLAKDNNAILTLNPSEHILPNQGRNVKNYLDNIFSKILLDDDSLIQSTYTWESVLYKPIPYSPNLKLRGHFQSYKYFDHNRQYIQDLFLKKSEKIHSDITAIQVRRGDYHKFPDHHPQLTPEYFVKAVKILNPKELHIFSDDIEWCKNNLKFDIPIIYVRENTDWEEMMIMSYSKNIIISNSSFGWWAAYLNTRNDKRVIAPQTWFGPAITNNGFKIEDLIPSEWTLI